MALPLPQTIVPPVPDVVGRLHTLGNAGDANVFGIPHDHQVWFPMFSLIVPHHAGIPMDKDGHVQGFDKIPKHDHHAGFDLVG